MKKRKKRSGSRRGMQLVTLCISTTMVLVLLGLVVFSVLTSRNLSAWVKENLTVTVMLSDDASVNDAKRDTQSAAVNGAEDGRRINNCTHIGRKFTKKK